VSRSTPTPLAAKAMAEADADWKAASGGGGASHKLVAISMDSSEMSLSVGRLLADALGCGYGFVEREGSGRPLRDSGAKIVAKLSIPSPFGHLFRQ
jgi:hypothetical protein